ncbi:MAG: hypothetical protein VX899_00190 [Myxococcota bacterium]|nr:hypothetical protein [Myxococcota bacterium]
MSAPSPSQDKPLTPNGKRWVAGIVLGLMLVVGVNLYMMKVAMDSHPDLVESYENEENRK